MPTPAIEIVKADLDDLATLRDHLSGCTAAYYLVHAMQSAGRDYAERDRAMAQRFTKAAHQARVARLLYLGGLGHSAHGLTTWSRVARLKRSSQPVRCR